MRRLLSFRLLLLLGWLAPMPATPAATAAENHAATAAENHAATAAENHAATAAQNQAASPPPASPWEHPLWHNATTAMRLYVCDHARRPPNWCAAEAERPVVAALPELQGPLRTPEDAAWQNFLETAVPAEFGPEEVAMVRRRAVERRDPQAMEILGFLYAEGLAVKRDYVEAYRWYGLAFLAGEVSVRANMDIVWELLQRHDLEGAMALAREFDALAAGEVPAGLAPDPSAPVQSR